MNICLVLTVVGVIVKGEMTLQSEKMVEFEVGAKFQQSILNITYSCNLKVEFGKRLTPTQAEKQPQIQWNADADAFYTLGMLDLDAPSPIRPADREFRHWLVGNIPENNINNGDVLSNYIGPGPPQDTGFHRYIFLLYKQPEKITFNEEHLLDASVTGRRKFSIEKFAAKYNLGKPIAVNMYQAAWDNSVIMVHKKLGI